MEKSSSNLYTNTAPSTRRHFHLTSHLLINRSSGLQYFVSNWDSSYVVSILSWCRFPTEKMSLVKDPAEIRHSRDFLVFLFIWVFIYQSVIIKLCLVYLLVTNLLISVQLENFFYVFFHIFLNFFSHVFSSATWVEIQIHSSQLFSNLKTFASFPLFHVYRLLFHVSLLPW